MSEFIPFLDLKRVIQAQRELLDGAWNRVLDSGYLVLGNEVKNFESSFAKKVHANWTVGCANGTDSLELSLKALNIGPGDEVITTPLTAMPTLMGLAASGAKIVLADVEKTSGLIDSKSISDFITSKTKAIMPVHLYGQICDMDGIKSLAIKHSLKIIEDCAQSFGATKNDLPSGSWGELASWSFYPTKNLGALGDGGAISGNNTSIETKLRGLRNYGQSALYHHDFVGRNSRLDELQAAILVDRLKLADQELVVRKKIATQYSESLKGKISILSGPIDDPKNESCFHLFAIVAPYSREQFQNRMKENGVGTMVHYPIPAHKQKAFSNLEFNINLYPNANFLAEQVVSLPLNPYMKDWEIERVINAVHAIT